MRRTLLLTAALALLLAPGCAKSFRPFEPSDGSFTVQMPGRADSSTETLTFTQPDGRPLSLDFQAYGARSKGVHYLVLYVDLPPKTTVNLSSGVQSLAGAWKGNVVSETDGTLAGQPARAFSTTVKAPASGTAHGRVAVIGARVYVLMVAGGNCEPTDDNVQKFFTSFTPAATAAAPEPTPQGKPVRPSLTGD
jgi:hypothetical protein